MSQASGAAREASMDEILASIRRIIEESDAAAANESNTGFGGSDLGTADDGHDRFSSFDEGDKSADSLGSDDDFEDDDHISEEIIAAGEAELKAFREAMSDKALPAQTLERDASIADEASAESRKSEPETRKAPMSLAEIQARLAEQADQLEGRHDDAAPAATDISRPIDEPDEGAAAPLDEGADESEAEMAAPYAGETVISNAETLNTSVSEEPQAEQQSALSEENFRAVGERLERQFSKPGSHADQSAEVNVAETASANTTAASDAPRKMKSPQSEVAAAISPIVSREAGLAVAGSFGQLKEAFFASRQRNFDEMAEDMLRPMLQEWLDDNLPTMVERLVREEIERIAQGG